jgi:outer membrane protein
MIDTKIHSRTPENRRRTIVRAAVNAAFAVMIIALSAGCSALANREASTRTPKDPASQWTPPAKAMPRPEPSTPAIAIPEDLIESKSNWTLEDIVDLALRNNPATRATWQAARAASAHYGSERGAYFPQINASGSYSKTKNSYSQQFSVVQKTYQPSLTLHFILFDFGKTHADVEEARQQLYTANWSHNAMVQNVTLEVETAYYRYLYAKAVRSADSAAVEEARVNLDAAEERHKAGLATVADVLQAKSNYSQKKLALQTVEGEIQTIRGSLATAMGLSPTIDYDIGFLPSDIPTAEVSETVEELIQEAQARRPDLAAARASALGARAHAKSVARSGLPVITLEGSMSRRFYDNPDIYSDNYAEGIFLNVPLFTGFSHLYDVVEARAKADAASQQYEVLKGQVDLDVWSSYYDLKTASERLNTAREFLESAAESHTVALERYKAGVGSILELLGAQTALEDARAQSLQARTDWFLALAGLAHATGRLDLSEAPSSPHSPEAHDKDGR